jgi:hypothetical protein
MNNIFKEVDKEIHKERNNHYARARISKQVVHTYIIAIKYSNNKMG